MKKLVTLVLVGATIFVFAACKPTSAKDFKAVGSCKSYADTSCWDLAVMNDQVKKICSGGAFDLKPTPCDRAGVIGGCHKENMIMWYSASSDVKTLPDVKKKCLTGAKLVTPTGEEVK